MCAFACGIAQVICILMMFQAFSNIFIDMEQELNKDLWVVPDDLNFGYLI